MISDKKASPQEDWGNLKFLELKCHFLFLHEKRGREEEKREKKVKRRHKEFPRYQDMGRAEREIYIMKRLQFILKK